MLTHIWVIHQTQIHTYNTYHIWHFWISAGTFFIRTFSAQILRTMYTRTMCNKSNNFWTFWSHLYFVSCWHVFYRSWTLRRGSAQFTLYFIICGDHSDRESRCWNIVDVHYFQYFDTFALNVAVWLWTIYHCIYTLRWSLWSTPWNSITSWFVSYWVIT